MNGIDSIDESIFWQVIDKKKGAPMKTTGTLAVAFKILLPLNAMAVEAHHSADAKASQSTA